MNTNTNRMVWLALGSLLALLVASAWGQGGSSPETSLAITSVQTSAKAITVNVTVPPGVKQVTLESRTRLGAGNWVPRAVQRVNGATALTFTIDQNANVEVLRVRADAQDPLPAGFYTGDTNFNGQASAIRTVDNGLTPTAGPGGVVDANSPSYGGGTRTVVESDIWKVQGNTVYFFNQYRGLQVIDVTTPDAPVVKGTLDLPAAGEEMYLLDDTHVILLASDYSSTINGTLNSQALIVNVAGQPKVVQSLPISGSVQESRLVGTALYVASQTYQEIITPTPGKPDGAAGSQWQAGTVVTSFDLADPEHPVSRTTLWYPGYGNTIYATDEYLFVATQNVDNYWQSLVNIIDISDPDGTMTSLSSLATVGIIRDKFKLNQSGDILTVASEANQQDGRQNRRFSAIQTFSLANPASPQKLGYLEIGHGEGLYATRFDGTRVYVVTYLRMDPLWVVDLKDPANPTIVGELQVPGWSTYIQPLGDRLVAIGVDNSNSWKVAVSLFDVSDPAHPGLLSKVPLGTDYSWSEANYDEKALTVLPDAGVVMVPYQSSGTNGWVNQVQLIDLGTTTLTARGVIDHQMQPRRTAALANRIVSISGRDFLTVDATDRDHPKVTADLELSWPVNRTFLVGDYVIEESDAATWEGLANPVLRVVQPGDLYTPLARVELTNSYAVLGGTVKDGYLYLAQGPSAYYGIIPLDSSGGKPDSSPTNPPNLFLSIYDLSQLPNLTLKGQTSITTTNLPWGLNLTPLWVKPGLLALSGNGGGPIYWFGGGILAPGGIIARPWWGWGGNGSGRLFAFDVNSASNPKFVSEVNLTETNQWWGFSSAYTVNGLVYVSHQSSEFVPGATLPGQNPAPPKPAGSADTNQPPQGIWVTKYYLDVVDYADPANPTERKPVNLPGQLQGLARNGNLLYTMGPHWDTNWQTDWTQYLDASGYDGVNAYLVDSLKLASSWPSPVTAPDGTVYLGQTQTNNTGSLQAWTVSDAGKFTLLGSKDLPGGPTTLDNYGFLLAVQMSQTINLYDITNPAGITYLNGVNSYGWLSPDLSRADGALSKGVWAPLQDYGVWGIPVKP